MNADMKTSVKISSDGLSGGMLTVHGENGKALVDADSYGETTVDAVNRRGRSARIRVICSAFRASDVNNNGALLLMEAQP